MVREYIKKNFNENEPILIQDMRIDTMNKNAIRQAVNRMVLDGDLVRFDTGVYYRPQISTLFGLRTLEPYKVIERKYIKDNFQTFGYLTGMRFANIMGLTTQVPFKLEITSNNEASKGREVQVGWQKVRLKKPVVRINSENAKILQFLEGVANAELYTEYSIDETVELLKAYIIQNNLTKEDLHSVEDAITEAAAKKLILWELIYDFAS